MLQFAADPLTQCPSVTSEWCKQSYKILQQLDFGRRIDFSTVCYRGRPFTCKSDVVVVCKCNHGATLADKFGVPVDSVRGRRRLRCSLPLRLYAFAAVYVGINWTASFGHRGQFAIRTACVTTYYHCRRSNCSLKRDLHTTPNNVRHRCSLSCHCDAVTSVSIFLPGADPEERGEGGHGPLKMLKSPKSPFGLHYDWFTDCETPPTNIYA